MKSSTSFPRTLAVTFAIAENYDRRAYITDDDTIDVDDVNALIRIILGK